MTQNIVYTPPPIIKTFLKHYLPSELWYSWITGPVGSGKTTSLFFKLIYMAKLQAPAHDGIRRSRAVIVRNTLPQLKDTTLKSWFSWFQDGVAGTWDVTNSIFNLKFGDVECEVLFRPLDTPRDIARVLSLELTFAIIDEFTQIPREIIEALSARCRRFPAKKDGGATNFGMWGSSNTDTEDNWWYEYLHNELPENTKFFEQPSGYSPDAENLENLEGGVNYYYDIAKGKGDAWIKQFIESEWGFSVAGKPVIGTFNSELHIAKGKVRYDPTLPVVVGVDPGLTGSALIFGQCDLYDRLRVIGELVQSGYGAERLISERLKPYIRTHFPDAQIIIAPDPAAAQRAQNNEKAVVDTFRRFYSVKIETNNRLSKRVDAIEHFTARLTDVGAALIIDKEACPILIRALKGGWRFVMDAKREDTTKSPEPEKNKFSHPGDAFGYLARFYHRQTERELRYEGSGFRPFKPPIFAGRSYHAR